MTFALQRGSLSVRSIRSVWRMRSRCSTEERRYVVTRFATTANWDGIGAITRCSWYPQPYLSW